MTNLLTGQVWYAGLGRTILSGALISGIAGGGGYGAANAFLLCLQERYKT